MGELNTNSITLVGTLVGDFELDHESVGEKFYKNYISTMRDSGTEDVLPVIVSGKLLESTSGVSGQKVYINGRISTKNIKGKILI
jgi:single-stranded DNA-binding protein